MLLEIREDSSLIMEGEKDNPEEQNPYLVVHPNYVAED